MAAQRLQKGDEYTKRLVRFTPEACAVIQGRADASHLSFNAALMEFIRTATPAEEWRALERKVRKARRQPSAVCIRGEVIAGQEGPSWRPGGSALSASAAG